MRRWHQNTEADGATASSSVSSISNEKQLEAFKVFDMDGNGYIDKHELRYTMRRLGENLSEEDVKDMFKEADLNGDGMIDFSGRYFWRNCIKIWPQDLKIKNKRRLEFRLKPYIGVWTP